jgi:hypothetical protein
MEFTRSSEAYYSRNLLIFTDNLASINLRLTLGISLD